MAAGRLAVMKADSAPTVSSAEGDGPAHRGSRPRANTKVVEPGG